MTVVLDLDGVLTEHPRVLAAAASERFGVDLPERAFIDAAGLEISDEIRGWVYAATDLRRTSRPPPMPRRWSHGWRR